VRRSTCLFSPLTTKSYHQLLISKLLLQSLFADLRSFLVTVSNCGFIQMCVVISCEYKTVKDWHVFGNVYVIN